VTLIADDKGRLTLPVEPGASYDVKLGAEGTIIVRALKPAPLEVERPIKTVRAIRGRDGKLYFPVRPTRESILAGIREDRER